MVESQRKDHVTSILLYMSTNEHHLFTILPLLAKPQSQLSDNIVTSVVSLYVSDIYPPAESHNQ